VSALADPPESVVGEPAIELDGQLSFEVGGKEPTSTTIRLTGGKVSIDAGQLEKGQDVILRVVARVSEVAFVDELDATTKQPVACERRHKARIVDVGLLEA
jgi:hypothetical protein